MINNSVCKAIGIGTIKIKIFDEVVRTLSVFKNFLGSRESLISLVL